MMRSRLLQHRDSQNVKSTRPLSALPLNQYIILPLASTSQNSTPLLCACVSVRVLRFTQRVCVLRLCVCV
jgi:hypothetical protein